MFYNFCQPTVQHGLQNSVNTQYHTQHNISTVLQKGSLLKEIVRLHTQLFACVFLYAQLYCLPLMKGIICIPNNEQLGKYLILISGLNVASNTHIRFTDNSILQCMQQCLQCDMSQVLMSHKALLSITIQREAELIFTTRLKISRTSLIISKSVNERE